jgi:hypothetical protein
MMSQRFTETCRVEKDLLGDYYLQRKLLFTCAYMITETCRVWKAFFTDVLIIKRSLRTNLVRVKSPGVP